jgi:Ca2+-binding RTX toxin-like protein
VRTKVVAILALVSVAIVGILVMAAIINGTPGDDTLTDTPANDVIRGFAGDDNITSNFKNDRIDGGEGDDQILITSPGRAYVVGGPGNDVIVSAQTGSFSVQRLFGNDGDDNIVVGMSPHGSRIEGGDGDDVIDVNNVSGNNVIYGGDGDDEIEAINSAGNNKIYGGLGQDNITLGSGSNFVEPGEDADVVVAGTASTSRDVINIRVGDVPAGETEKITCTVDADARTTIILKRNSLGAFPRGTPTSFDASGVLTIIDPATGGVYEIRKGDGNCIIVRR